MRNSSPRARDWPDWGKFMCVDPSSIRRDQFTLIDWMCHHQPETRQNEMNEGDRVTESKIGNQT